MSFASLGRPSLLAALLFALLTLLLSLVGAIRHRDELALAGVRALRTSALFTLLATLALLSGLFAKDFSLEYVANYTSRSLPGAYTFTALWGGMEGSLLFWTALLTMFSAIAVGRTASPSMSVTAWSATVLAGIAAFFLALLAMPADPFTRLPTVPADGSGLNPLLQSPGMAIHPPLLYTGFVAFSIPFAFALAALISGRLDQQWFTATRRWTLFAWSALSVGIVLGGAWAYTELGWGGYWAWDPVENASFMPWLTATAFLHSVVIQEKRRMLKVWNVALILLTYVLAVFGTFLTRSGLLSSIHTFTEGPIGKWFLPFLAVMVVGGIAAIAVRLDRLRSDNALDSLVSRESAFLANNVLFVAATFAVLWGTIYPIFAEVVTGVRLSVGPPFFNSVFVPLGLAIIALTGLGPLIAWRRMSRGALVRLVRAPLAIGAFGLLVLAALGVRSVGALVAFGVCAFTATAISGEFVRGSRVYRRREGLAWIAALGRTIARNRRRYGGYIVHLGVVLIVIGVAGRAFVTERAGAMEVGDRLQIAGYELRFDGVRQARTEEKQINEARLTVMRGGEAVGVLTPQRNFHFAQRQPQSEIAIRTNPIEDLYVVVTDIQADGTALVRAFVNPLTWWIWAGAGVMVAGIAVLFGGARPAADVARVPARSREAVVAAR